MTTTNTISREEKKEMKDLLIRQREMWCKDWSESNKNGNTDHCQNIQSIIKNIDKRISQISIL